MTPDEMRRAAAIFESESVYYDEIDVHDEMLALARLLREEADAKERPPAHLYRGWCPDEATDPHTRDRGCQACRLLPPPPRGGEG